jgi:hypothetical protein
VNFVSFSPGADVNGLDAHAGASRIDRRMALDRVACSPSTGLELPPAGMLAQNGGPPHDKLGLVINASAEAADLGSMGLAIR